MTRRIAKDKEIYVTGAKNKGKSFQLLVLSKGNPRHNVKKVEDWGDGTTEERSQNYRAPKGQCLIP